MWLPQRYRPRGPYGPGSVPVKIYAPLPQYFLNVCGAAGLTRFLPPQFITGGLMASGERVQKGDIEPGLEAKWLGDGASEEMEWTEEERYE